MTVCLTRVCHRAAPRWSLRRRRVTSAVLGLCGLGLAPSAACTQEVPKPIAWQTSFACTPHAQRAERVEVTVARGGCPTAGPPLYKGVFHRGADTEPAGPGALPPGTYAIEGVALDADSRVLSAACTTVELPRSHAIELILNPIMDCGTAGSDDAGLPEASLGDPLDGAAPQRDGGTIDPPIAGPCGRVMESSPTVALTARVAHFADDGEEARTIDIGRVSLDSVDLEMTTEEAFLGTVKQAVGFRFATVGLPAGARIDEAYLEFMADGSNSERTDLELTVEASDNGPRFAARSHDLTNRLRARSTVSWQDVPAWTIGESYRTPNLAAPLQELACRPGWSSESAVVVLIEGTGVRQAVAYDQNPATAATLQVRYRL